MCHVLVIEDEPLVAMLIADIAENAGATSVVFATSEDEALDHARAGVPGIILSDVDLKQGGTGPNSCEKIRSELGPVSVIFITATPAMCDKCDYAEAILDKPIREEISVEVFRGAAPLAA